MIKAADDGKMVPFGILKISSARHVCGSSTSSNPFLGGEKFIHRDPVALGKHCPQSIVLGKRPYEILADTIS